MPQTTKSLLSDGSIVRLYIHCNALHLRISYQSERERERECRNIRHTESWVEHGQNKTSKVSRSLKLCVTLFAPALTFTLTLILQSLSHSKCLWGDCWTVVLTAAFGNFQSIAKDERVLIAQQLVSAQCCNRSAS